MNVAALIASPVSPRNKAVAEAKRINAAHLRLLCWILGESEDQVLRRIARLQGDRIQR